MYHSRDRDNSEPCGLLVHIFCASYEWWCELSHRRRSTSATDLTMLIHAFSLGPTVAEECFN